MIITNLVYINNICCFENEKKLWQKWREKRAIIQLEETDTSLLRIANYHGEETPSLNKEIT